MERAPEMALELMALEISHSEAFAILVLKGLKWESLMWTLLSSERLESERPESEHFESMAHQRFRAFAWISS